MTRAAVIPRPRPRPVVGNLLDVRPAHAIEDLTALARIHGPIFRMEAFGRRRVFVSGAALVEEVCDEKRFTKTLGPGLAVLRRGGGGTGLFTAETDDPEWRRAHNILMPAFTAEAMRGYFPRMLDLVLQLAQKWERLNPGEDVDVAADMTRLTLDTIALCGFDYRFNSFYRDRPHPFVQAMFGVLATAQASVRQVPGLGFLQRGRDRRLLADQATMARIVETLIEQRRASPRLGQVGDLLDRMLTGVDRESGLSLDDRNIIAQCLTFLIAGHETTSGLLSFALYGLVKHEEALARAYEEVDRVLGRDPTVLSSYGQIREAKYLTQVLEEALRLWPTAPAFFRRAVAPTMIGDGYALSPAESIMVLAGPLHRDPSVWGPDPERFDPDRFSPERRRTIPPHAYKPFGTGVRACIGRSFALVEAALALAVILQRFTLEAADDYQLKVKLSLTIKPEGFRLRPRPR